MTLDLFVGATTLCVVCVCIQCGFLISLTYCVYTQLLTQQNIGNMDGGAVGQQAGNVNSSAPYNAPVQSQQSYWDEKITCSRCKSLFVRSDGYCNHRNLYDLSRVFLCKPCYLLVDTVHSD